MVCGLLSAVDVCVHVYMCRLDVWIVGVYSAVGVGGV